MSNIIIAIALAAVFIVLLMGLFNMMRGGDSNRSQMLMRWRVGLQFAAIIIVLIVVWLKRG
jgi:heme/copper-type cytochrome/quinol oxidase subunit 4